MTSIVNLPYEYFFDPDSSRPISNGFVYVGVIDLEPEIPANQLPVTLRQEDGTEVIIDQSVTPIRTGVGGGPEYNGSPVQVLVDGAYSIKVLDSLGAQKFYSANVADGVPLTEGTGVSAVPFLADLIALDVTVIKQASVSGRTVAGDGFEGDFNFVQGNQSANVTADPLQGVWVAPASDTTGSSGAWKRDDQGLTNVKNFGAKGDGVTDDTAAIQTAFDSEFDVTIPDGQYRVTGLTLTKGKAINCSEGATFKPIAPLGSYVLEINGSAQTVDGETGMRVQINRIAIDGGSRAYAIDGVKFDHVTRSEIGVIMVNNLDGTAIDAHAFRETVINTIRTRDCGSWTNGTTYDAVVDLGETVLTGDGNNNLFIENWFSIYSRGPDLVIDSANTRASNPRKIHFNNLMVHGHIEASDPLGNPLSTAEKADRIQMILGTCEEVYFGEGSIQFAATSANPIHITPGTNGPAGRIDFGDVRIHSRYDFASGISNFGGINIDSGEVHLEGISMGSGYTGFNAIEAASGVNLFINPFNQKIDTGSVSITDIETVFVRSMDIDMGANDLLNVRIIKSGSAALEFREGQSGSSRKAFEVKNSANAANARTVFFGFSQQSAIALPLAASMIADGVGSALAYDGTGLRWFDGTVWRTVTVT